jgi:hypothetical protein
MYTKREYHIKPDLRGSGRDDHPGASTKQKQNPQILLRYFLLLKKVSILVSETNRKENLNFFLIMIGASTF